MGRGGARIGAGRPAKVAALPRPAGPGDWRPGPADRVGLGAEGRSALAWWTRHYAFQAHEGRVIVQVAHVEQRLAELRARLAVAVPEDRLALERVEAQMVGRWQALLLQLKLPAGRPAVPATDWRAVVFQRPASREGA